MSFGGTLSVCIPEDYSYDEVNQGHLVCPLYGGSPYLGGSIMGGSTVQQPLLKLETIFHTCNFQDMDHLHTMDKPSVPD